MRVWVTGVGIVSPLARGADATMDRLLAGDRGVGPLTLFELPGARSKLAGEVRGLDVAAIAPIEDAAAWSRTDALARLAADEALASAGLALPALGDAREGLGLVVGGSTTGMFENELPLAEMSRDAARLAPYPVAESHPLSATTHRLVEAFGPGAIARVATVCSACSSGANAIALGAGWVRRGLVSRVLAGGSDGLSRLTYAGFSALSAMSGAPCKPFDVARAGLNLGEGAAFLVLESEASARARGRAPIAELAGWSIASEAHHITNPDASGQTAARVVAEALARAGVRPSELDYVNAHGTATPLNDAMEAAALRAALGADVGRVAVSSTKGQIGHTLAAAGAIEAAVTALAIARGAMPPTGGLDDVDPACGLDILKVMRKGRVRAAISNSFGFGGGDTALALTEPEAFRDAGAPRATSVVVTGVATVGALGVVKGDANIAYLDPAPAAAVALNLGEHLDIARARRIDRAGRYVTIAAGQALDDAGLGDGEGVGMAFGTAFSSVDASIAFTRRVVDKGAAFASPADFPNLVPSSPVGHASIYLGLRGLALATADLGASAESAVVTALDLLAAGEARAIVAGAVDEASAIIDACVGPVTSGPRAPRGTGAAAIVLEDEASARARGARPIARVTEHDDGAPPPPSPVRALCVVARAVDARSLGGWADVPCVDVQARAGTQDGAGGVAMAAAVAAIARGQADAVLVVAEVADRAVKLLFQRFTP